MLPFLRPKQIASVIMSKQTPDGHIEDQHKEDEQHPMLVKHAEDLVRAVHAKDSEAVAGAMSNIHNHMKEAHAPAKEQE